VPSRSPSVVLLVSALAAALTLAQWPDGHITGKDRELVARLTRGAHQRLDSDTGHGSAEASDPHLLIEPAGALHDTASSASDEGLPAAWHDVTAPAAPSAMHAVRPWPVRASVPSRPRGRAPPTL
jgi:hypothetical protein